MDAIIAEKRCCKCGEIKALGDFYAKYKQCKKCTDAVNAEYRKSHREKINILSWLWGNNNREKRLESQKKYAEISMQNLNDTLAYVTFIIDIQNQLNNCPKSIYG